MPLRKTEAVVLKTYPYGETSLIVHLISPWRGKLHLLAKGARRSRSKALSGLEPFCLVEVMYFEKEDRELHTVRESTLLQANTPFRENLSSWALANLFFEVVDKVSVSGEQQKSLFDLAGVFLRQVGEWDKVESASYLPFLYALLKGQGVAPLIARCVECGGKKTFVGIAIEKGGVLCQSCHNKLTDRESYSFFPLKEGTRKILLHFLLNWDPASTGRTIRLSRQQEKELLDLFERMCRVHLHTHLKSLPMLQQLMEKK
jgi:DNA repair protein RecO (recombination protein O)